MTGNGIKLIVGLGNPGSQYDSNRHNAGVIFLHHLAKSYSGSLRGESKFFGEFGSVNIVGDDIKLLFPTTFMNNSGKSVAAVCKFYKIEPDNMLVAYDEIDFDVGVTRFKHGGGHGGHNGLKDIIAKMANNKEFMRLRVGIGHPGHRDKVTGWVLGKAPQADQEKIDAAVDEAVRCMEILAKDGVLKAQNRLHSFKP